LEQYQEDSGAGLLIAAVQGEGDLPVTLSDISGGGEGVSSPGIALNYEPDFRFIEAQRSVTSTDVVELIQQWPGKAFSVASYSLSSDLSHSNSPKACKALETIVSNGLEPEILEWELRLPKIVLQLLQYSPDFMCIQCLQSSGFVERCSEWEDGWFDSDTEPQANHLAQLYKQLRKSGYSVAFAPTLRLPGSDTLCFGTAVFWKHSHWQMKQQWTIPCAGICVELASKLDYPSVLLCSSKTAASYAQDWGDKVDNEDLMEPNIRVQMAIKEALNLSGAIPVWCGDFGIGQGTVLPELALPETGHVWRSTCDSVQGHTSWTSFPELSNQSCSAVDLILHDACLEAVAVLGGHRKATGLAEWFKTGYPSDHLMQLAVFAAPSCSDTGKSSSELPRCSQKE
jgi:hypothetical protein